MCKRILRERGKRHWGGVILDEATSAQKNLTELRSIINSGLKEVQVENVKDFIGCSERFVRMLVRRDQQSRPIDRT